MIVLMTMKLQLLLAVLCVATTRSEKVVFTSQSSERIWALHYNVDLAAAATNNTEVKVELFQQPGGKHVLVIADMDTAFLCAFAQLDRETLFSVQFDLPGAPVPGESMQADQKLFRTWRSGLEYLTRERINLWANCDN